MHVEEKNQEALVFHGRICQFQMEYNDEHEKIIEHDDDGGWVDTHHFDKSSELEEKILDLTIDTAVRLD